MALNVFNLQYKRYSMYFHIHKTLNLNQKNYVEAIQSQKH